MSHQIQILNSEGMTQADLQKIVEMSKDVLDKECNSIPLVCYPPSQLPRDEVRVIHFNGRGNPQDDRKFRQIKHELVMKFLILPAIRHYTVVRE